MIQIPENTLVIIDGSLYLYRAYHTFPFLTNQQGKPTGAIYGMLNMLRSLIFEYLPTHIVVVFDANSKTFRNKLFTKYKSHRPSMPNNLQAQIASLHLMINIVGLPIIVVPNVEADDVIGTLAKKVEKSGRLVLISSNDKDMAQLVTSKIKLINITTNSILGIEEIINKYGIHPNLMIDFLALTGDSSDNIPGVPGIGKKLAQVLLNNFGGLNELYSNPEKIASLSFRGAQKIAKILKKNKEMAYLSYQLAKIKTDIKLKLTYEQLLLKKVCHQRLLPLFKEYEFKSWIKNINKWKWPHVKNSELSTTFNNTIIKKC